MMESSSFYNRLGDRDGFNASVRHINRTLDLLGTCGPKKNIADEINRLLSEKNLENEEIQAVVNMLLVEKWKYAVMSRNLVSITEDASLVSSETGKWQGIDLVVGYHHPDVGFMVINPKNPQSAEFMAGFRKNEMLVLYAGSPDSADSAKAGREALPLLLDLIEGRTVKTPASLQKGPFVFAAAKKAGAKKPAAAKSVRQGKAAGFAPKTAASSTIYNGPAAAAQAAPAETRVRAAAPAPTAVPGQSKMSPLISVVVSNELFHNGNVEAWKRIIRSYNAKYPNLQVFIYYDGERIVDINTLFKWGKVKHGSCIQFCVSGDNIQDLAKLSRYFRQGASPQFEAFLHGSPDSVMNLF
jgi:hypothetical protein